MLRLEVIYTDTSREEFFDILKVTLRKSTDTPAHSLSIELPFGVEKEVCELRLSDETGLVFEGIADEQITKFSEGVKTEFSARSMEALLLDNEALPEIYKNPSSSLIFSRYGECCSLQKFEAESRSLKGLLKVYKGMSCYQVLKGFCEAVYGKTPCVFGRTLCLEGDKTQEEILFCDEGEGVVCSSIESAYSRYHLISKVVAKTAADGAYSLEVCDEESRELKIYRQRFADVSGADVVSLSRIHKTLKDGRDKSLSLTVSVNGRMPHILGASARVIAGGKEYKGLQVKEIIYTLKGRKEQTKITLIKKEK